MFCRFLLLILPIVAFASTTYATTCYDGNNLSSFGYSAGDTVPAGYLVFDVSQGAYASLLFASDSSYVWSTMVYPYISSVYSIVSGKIVIQTPSFTLSSREAFYAATGNQYYDIGTGDF